MVIPWSDWTFVFGSNLKGIHGSGAAKDAVKYWGAEYGVGAGPTGRAYAIPTKYTPGVVMSLDEINKHVDEFINYAKSRSEETFLLTRIGCGLAGYTDDDIKPMFNNAPDNVIKPGIWRDSGIRLIIAGSRFISDKDHVFKVIDDYMSKHNIDTIISGGARGVDTIAIEYSKEHDIPYEIYYADWNHHGLSAGYIRNKIMTWSGTHLLAIWDGESKGTKHIINHAKKNKLKTTVIKLQGGNHV